MREGIFSILSKVENVVVNKFSQLEQLGYGQSTSEVYDK